jgi:hypothetical protein
MVVAIFLLSFVFTIQHDFTPFNTNIGKNWQGGISNIINIQESTLSAYKITSRKQHSTFFTK